MTDLGRQVFLSPNISEEIARIRTLHSSVFDLCERLNELTHDILFSLSIDTEDVQQSLVVCLFQRAASLFQGAVIMTERGMHAETIILLRSLLEVVFRIAAISKNRDIAKAYALEDEAHRRKWINKFNLLSDEMKEAVGNPEHDELLEEIKQNIKDKNIKELSTQWFAEQAGLADTYHSVYSVLSRTVHVNVRDLESLLVLDDKNEIVDFNYGPNNEEVDNHLLAAVEYMIIALRSVITVFKTSHAVAVDKIHNCFVQLFTEKQAVI